MFPCLMAFATASRTAIPIQCSTSSEIPRSRHTFASAARTSSMFSNRLDSQSTTGSGPMEVFVISFAESPPGQGPLLSSRPYVHFQE